MASAPLEISPCSGNSPTIQRVKYTHDAMIDVIIRNPSIKQNDIALHFGYTPAWVSRVFNSDAFQARLAERKHDLVDPTILLTLDEKFRAMADASMDIIQEKLMLTKNVDLAAKALELSAKALGYGARQQNVAIQTTFVVALPTQATSQQDWATKHRASLQAGNVTIIEAEVDPVHLADPEPAAQQSLLFESN